MYIPSLMLPETTLSHDSHPFRLSFFPLSIQLLQISSTLHLLTSDIPHVATADFVVGVSFRRLRWAFCPLCSAWKALASQAPPASLETLDQ